MNLQFQTASSSQAKTITIDTQTYQELIDHQPQKQTKMDYFNRQGWGFADSGFVYQKENNQVKIKGTRYMHGGECLPSFLPFCEQNLGVDIRYTDPKQEDMQI